MFKGIGFLMRYTWRFEKRYILYQIARQILVAVVPLSDIIIPKYIIDELTGGKRVEVLLGWIGLLLAINLLGNWLINFFQGNTFVLKGKVFTKFQTMMADQLSKSDFERLEDPAFLDTKAKAEKFLYANGQGFAAVLGSAFDILGQLFTFVGIVAVIMTLNIWIVLGFIVLILINAFYDSRVRKQMTVWDLEKAPIERKTSYFLDLVENFAFGKEIRIYGIREWIVSKVHEHLQESNRFYTKQTKLLNRTRYISTFTNFILKGVTYVYLAFSVLKNVIGIGDFTMYVSALLNFSNAMKSLMDSLLNIRQFGGYYDALKDYMDVPQRMLDYDAYMKLIGSVFQDYKLLAFTLKENVAFQNSAQEDDIRIQGILTRSGLGTLLGRLPKGIHTHIYHTFAEDGFDPSGGEGKKIALARAIYKDAPVMILDEPTAALDPRAENEIYQNFSQLTSGKTTVFISHRMSSSKFCDHIALFRNGEIAEYGTHDELMAKNGGYRELFEMQAQYYV